ncbi:acyl dehydratase [Streptomyces canus]|uniref:Acyl dehydratase n=1 Tax=Streptomyces canus TaxID=58343 RepID=A0AAW8F4M5_9ACTN|nr:hypothetical protein [Streptomyces canus]MDQ0904181.1 acyl dehydratase [Streptomyces canus]
MIFPELGAGARWLVMLAVYIPTAAASATVWTGLHAVHTPQPLAVVVALLIAIVSAVVITYGIENVWPRPVQHDDALFCETGETGATETGSDS